MAEDATALVSAATATYQAYVMHNTDDQGTDSVCPAYLRMPLP